MASVAADPQSHTGTLQKKLRNVFHKDKNEPQGSQSKRDLSHRNVETFVTTQHANEAYKPNLSPEAQIMQWVDTTATATSTSTSAS